MSQTSIVQLNTSHALFISKFTIFITLGQTRKIIIRKCVNLQIHKKKIKAIEYTIIN